MAEENTEKNGEGALDLSALGSFDFTPDWAKGRPDDTSRYARFEAREERGEHGDRSDRARFPQGGQRRDDHGGGRRFPQGGQRRDERGGDRPRREDRPHFQRGGDRPQRPFVKPLDVDVRILPEQRQLGEFIRKIQSAPYMAYPLKQLAYFFLDHPEACVLRVSPKKDAEPISFHQCKACGFVAFSEEELMAHVVTAHLGDYYDCEEVECEPPKGTFTCVARCGLSGELLGPPNLHGYDARVREMLRTRYPDMDEAAYRARIEMVRDSDVVEQWRQSATKKTIYRRKGAQAAESAAEGEAAPAEVPAVEREMAELEFRRLFAPSLLTAPRTVDITADKALKSSNLGLVFACRDAIQKEKRFPSSLFFALRGAFHHRKLQFFRANDPRGPEFVIAVKPSALDTAHAIPELAALVKYVEAHLDLSPGAVAAALAEGDPEKAKAAKAHIMWLLEKGHLVCYANGGLVTPAEHPYWRPRQNRPPQAKPAAAVSTPETPEPAPAEPETPKPETPEPAPAEPETPKQETSEPVPTEPETSNLETPNPETSEPETSEPETSEPLS